MSLSKLQNISKKLYYTANFSLKYFHPTSSTFQINVLRSKLLNFDQKPFKVQLKRYQSSINNSNNNRQKDNSQHNYKEKLKKAIKDYGSTVIIFHIGISLISLGICYILLSSGFHIDTYFKGLLKEEKDEIVGSNTNIVVGAGTFAIAYGVHKMLAPIRIAITLSVAPLMVRWLRKQKIIK